MLTRIEIDGFKNLLGFCAEFGPFTCIAGPNAVGKSNLFDAIEFLSLLAEHPLDKAASLVRATPGAHEPARSLFWNDGDVWAERIHIAVELLVDGRVSDDLGRADLPDSPMYRYEIELRLGEGLRLVNERLTSLGSDALRFPHHPDFAKAHRLDRERHGKVIFDIGAGLMPDGSPPPDLDRAARTVVQLYPTIEHPEIIAVRAELCSWRRFALNPLELRKPHQLGSARQLSGSGEHLPLLFKQALESRAANGVGPAALELSADIVAKLGRIASLRSVHVDEDRERDLLILRATSRMGESLSARNLSEGSLRCLALILLGELPGNRLVCIEEPENGIHPTQFEDLKAILYELTTHAEIEHDVADTASPPLRQLIINTHSSSLVSEIYRERPGDLLMASAVLATGPRGRTARVYRLHPLAKTWRCKEGVRGVMLPVVDYVGAALLASTDASAAEDGS